MKPSPLRSLFAGTAVAFFLTLTLAAFAQEKPATAEAPPAPPAATPPATTPPPETPAAEPAPAAAPALRRLDEPAVEKAAEPTPAPGKAKKSRAQQIKERAENARRRAAEREAAHTGEPIVNVFADSELTADHRADAVVAIFGNVFSAGEVADAAVAVFGDSRITGPVHGTTVTIFGNSYVNSPVSEQVVVVFGDLQLGPEAKIEGDVVCVGGSITRDPAAVVGSTVTNVLSAKVEWLRTWLRECFLKARPLAFGRNLGWAWGVAAFCLAFYALAALIFRSGVEKCVTTLETRPGFSFLVALLLTLIIPVLMILLCLTGAGIFAVPFIAIGILTMKLFGTAVVLAWIGRRITRFFGDGPMNHAAVAVLVGGVIVTLLYTVPVFGFLLFKLIGWIGLGTVGYTMVLGMKREKAATRSSSGSGAPRASSPPPFTPPPAAAMPMSASASGAAAMSGGFVGAASVPDVIEIPASVPASPATAPADAAAETPPAPPPPTFAPPPVAPPPVAPLSGDGPASAPPPFRRTPPPLSAATLPRAGFWPRLGALALDGILIAVIVGFLSNLLPRMLRIDHGPGSVLITLAIYAAAMWKTKGTTIGGVVCGLKVVRLDDREIDWPTAIVRALSCFLSLVVGGLGFLWVVFDQDKQSWHDKIAGTTVVRVPKGVSLL